MLTAFVSQRFEIHSEFNPHIPLNLFIRTQLRTTRIRRHRRPLLPNELKVPQLAQSQLHCVRRELHRRAHTGRGRVHLRRRHLRPTRPRTTQPRAFAAQDTRPDGQSGFYKRIYLQEEISGHRQPEVAVNYFCLFIICS